MLQKQDWLRLVLLAAVGVTCIVTFALQLSGLEAAEGTLSALVAQSIVALLWTLYTIFFLYEWMRDPQTNVGFPILNIAVMMFALFYVGASLQMWVGLRDPAAFEIDLTRAIIKADFFASSFNIMISVGYSGYLKASSDAAMWVFNAQAIIAYTSYGGMFVLALLVRHKHRVVRIDEIEAYLHKRYAHGRHHDAEDAYP